MKMSLLVQCAFNSHKISIDLLFPRHFAVFLLHENVVAPLIACLLSSRCVSRGYSHPGYVAHKAHLYLARDLEWDPLETETNEEIRVWTYTLQDALAATLVDYRCDPEAALGIWLYAHSRD